MYYYGARYYDPSLGKFITPDTIVQNPSDPRTLNRYSYAGNNPVNLVDPNGHWFWAAIIIGAILGGASAAVNDQPIWKGVLVGATSGLFVGAGSAAFGFWGAVGGGMMGGALSSGVNGGNIGIGILSGGLGAGLGYGLGSWASGWNSGSFWGELGAAAFAGSVAGGVGAELSGGRFGEGAWRGAAFSTAGFLTANAVGNLDPRVRTAKKYEQESKKLHDLNVSKSDKVKLNAVSRNVGGTPANHESLVGWEMGPQKAGGGPITTSTTANDIFEWPTFRHTQQAWADGTTNTVPVEVSASGLVDAINLYNNTWAGGDFSYNAFSYNSNYAVNTVIYSSGGSVPGGLGWSPQFNTPPPSIYHANFYNRN